jgi:hypothetical protein
VVPCSLVERHQHLKKCAVSIFRIEEKATHENIYREGKYRMQVSQSMGNGGPRRIHSVTGRACERTVGGKEL